MEANKLPVPRDDDRIRTRPRVRPSVLRDVQKRSGEPKRSESFGVTTIIIQARIGSTRLPGKSLKAFRGQTVLWHVIKRCDQTGYPVIVAIPNNEPELSAWCDRHNVLTHEGDPRNLVRRYMTAAREYGANPIVRITADCPFINPELIKLTVRAFELQGNVGYMGFHSHPGLNVEVFDYDTLEEAEHQGFDEHCTTWMRKQKWAKDLPTLELNTQEDYQRLLSL